MAALRSRAGADPPTPRNRPRPPPISVSYFRPVKFTIFVFFLRYMYIEKIWRFGENLQTNKKVLV
jgi:hypothetical protein